MAPWAENRGPKKIGASLRAHLWATLFLSLLLPIKYVYSETNENQNNKPNTLSQIEAQRAAEKILNSGSDKSLESSATRAMQALVHFGSNNLGGAVKEGYRAWSAFKTSEDFDRDRKRSILAKVELSSIESASFTEQEAAFLASRTSYRRLDPKFLMEGESAKVAAEFERMTGIPRRDFLEMLSSLSENKLLVSNPKLASEVSSKFELFLQSIPNQTFRAKVKKTFGLVPDNIKEQLISKAIRASSSSRTVAQYPSTTDRAPAGLEDLDNEKDHSSSLVPNNEPSPDVIALAAQSFGFAPEEPQAGSEASGLGAVVKSALTLEPENESLFKRIHKKYQSLAPDFQ
jgi:hypothetical protein